MKKLIIAAAALVMMFVFAACGTQKYHIPEALPKQKAAVVSLREELMEQEQPVEVLEAPEEQSDEEPVEAPDPEVHTAEETEPEAPISVQEQKYMESLPVGQVPEEITAVEAPAAVPEMPACEEEQPVGIEEEAIREPEFGCCEHIWEEPEFLQFICDSDMETAIIEDFSYYHDAQRMRNLIGEEEIGAEYFHLYKGFRFVCTQCGEWYIQVAGSGFDAAHLSLWNAYPVIDSEKLR